MLNKFLIFDVVNFEVGKGVKIVMGESIIIGASPYSSNIFIHKLNEQDRFIWCIFVQFFLDGPEPKKSLPLQLSLQEN